MAIKPHEEDTENCEDCFMWLPQCKCKVLSQHDWIGLYCELSTFILEQSYSPHAIWEEDENGDEIMKDDKQDEFNSIVDVVEGIMRNNGLVKEDI